MNNLGKPSCSSVKIALHFEAEGNCDYKLIVMDVKCGLFYEKMRRHVYTEQISSGSLSRRCTGLVMGEIWCRRQ